MAIQAGTYKLGPDNASLTVETERTGAAAAAGHNLVLGVTSWEATLEVGPSSSLSLTADAASIKVIEGSGGMKALSDKDKGDIVKSIDKDILKKKAISFQSTSVEETDGGLKVSGELELVGTKKPLTFDLAASDGTLSGSATITQTSWGIKQFSAMFGALKVVDDVKVVVSDAKLG